VRASMKALPAESLESRVEAMQLHSSNVFAKTGLFSFRVVGLELGEDSEGHRGNWKLVVLQPYGVALTYPFR